MALIFDTETSGLPNCSGLAYGDYPCYTDLNKYKCARVVEVSYIVTDDTYTAIDSADIIIKSDNFIIDNYRFHGITNEISQKDGIPFVDFAIKFKYDLNKCNKMIAHNINFDINVLKSELYRYNLTDIIDMIDIKYIVCTMKFTKNIINIPSRNGKNVKDPNLKELYQAITGKELTNHHTCRYDTENLHEIVKILYDTSRFNIF